MLSQCLLQRTSIFAASKVQKSHVLKQLPSRSLRFYATHKDTSSHRRFTPSPLYRAGNAFPYSNLVRPLVFTILFTGASFGAAYYFDTSSSSTPDRDAKLKVLSSLVALNVLVFAGHQVPPYGRLSGAMYRMLQQYGHLDPRTVKQYPLSLLTSGFSHTEIWHLGLNMVGLYTVGMGLFDLLGTNQFLAVYGSAICWSGMAQLCVEYLRARKGVVPRGSLGASGGVYALLGAVAWYAPNASVYLLFLPFIPIKLGYAFTGMMTLDTVGLIRGWKTYGHAAHLAGGTAGLVYGVSGVPEAWIRKRKDSLRRHLSRWGR